jgi:hypothetical protein
MTEQIGRAEYQLDANTTKLDQKVDATNRRIKSSGTAAEQAWGKSAAAGATRAASATDKLNKSSTGLAANWNNMGKKGGLPTAILGGLGLGAGLASFTLITTAVSTLADTVMGAVRAADEEEASIARLNASLQANDAAWDGNMRAIENVIAEREKLAFNDQQQRDSLALLVVATKDLTAAQKLQEIAMGLSRLRGTELVETTTLLSKVYQGNLSSLKRFGISLTGVTTAEEALAKLQGLVNGQVEAFAETAQGDAARATQTWENAMEDFGATLSPVVAGLAELAVDVIPKIADGIHDLVQTIGSFDPAVQRVVAMNKAFDALEERTGLVNGELDELRQQWTGMARESENAAGTQEELAVALDAAAEDTIKLARWTKLYTDHALSPLRHETTGATGDTEEFNESLLELATHGLQQSRKEAQQLEKQWRRLQDGPDKNKRSIRQLQDAVEKWDRRYQKALRDRDYDSAALARNERNRVQQELEDRNAVQDELEQDRVALVGVKKARQQAGGKVNIPVSTPGLDAAISGMTLLRQVSLEAAAAAIRSQGSSQQAAGRAAQRRFNNGGGGSASGGVAPDGWRWVGERGRELVKLNSRTPVLDYANAMRFASAGRAPTVNGGDTYNMPVTVIGQPERPATPADTVRGLRRAAQMGSFAPTRRYTWSQP